MTAPLCLTGCARAALFCSSRKAFSLLEYVFGISQASRPNTSSDMHISMIDMRMKTFVSCKQKNSRALLDNRFNRYSWASLFNNIGNHRTAGINISNPAIGSNPIAGFIKEHNSANQLISSEDLPLSSKSISTCIPKSLLSGASSFSTSLILSVIICSNSSSVISD